jgi:hypothetical protein
MALCATIKYEKVKGLGNKGRPPNMKVGEQDDAGDPTPLDDADCPLSVMVDGIYANFLLENDAHGVITAWQQPSLPRYDWQASNAAASWKAIWGKMDLTHIFGFPLWEKEVFERNGLGDGTQPLGTQPHGTYLPCLPHAAELKRSTPSPAQCWARTTTSSS